MASATTTKGATGRSPLNMVLFYVFLVLFVLVSIFPLLWVFSMSITTRAQLLDSPTVTATAQQVDDNYSTVFGNPDLIQALVNSVIVPFAAPGVLTTAILTFIHAWNEFLFANTFIFDAAHYPVTVVITNFATIYTTNYGAQAAGAVVVTIPLVILVLIFQRRIVSGLTAGAVKG